MAGVQKEFELLFKLSASLGPNFNSSFKSALNTQKALQDSVKKVNSIQGKIDGYTKSSKAITEQSEKLEKLKSEHEKINESIKRHQQNADKLRDKIEETGDASGELTAQLVKEENEVQKDTEKLAKNETQIQQTTAKIEQQTQKLNELGQELEDAGVSTENLEEKNAELKKSYENLRQSQERLGQINQKQQELNQSISDTKGKLLATTGAIGAVAAAFYAGPIKTYQSFEEEMSTVAGITHATGEELEALKNAAKQAGQNTWATATESAQALEYMSLAGWSSEESIGALNDMLKIAKISGKDLGASTDLVTDSMSAMGLSVNELGHYLDVTVKANNVANTTSSDLMEAILGCAGAAKTNGMNLETLSTALSVFANNGLKGTQAGTAMNSILVRMTSNDKALSEMARLGVNAFDEQTGSFRDMGDILKDLEAKMSTMTDAQRDASLKAIAGTNYYSQFAYLLDSVSEAAEGTAGSWDVLTSKLNNADGAANEMYSTMMNNLSGAMTEAKSAIEAVQLALGEALTPALTKTVRTITPYIQKAATFISENQELTRTIMKAVAGLAALKVGGLGAKLGFLEGKKGILALQKGFTQLNILRESKKLGTLATNFGGVFKVLGPIAAIVAAVGGAIYYVSQNLEDVRKKIQKTFGDEGLAVFDQIWGVITQIGDAFKTAFSSAGTDVFSTLKEVIPPVINELQKAATTILPVLVQMVQQLAPVFAQLVSTLLPAIVQILGTIITVTAKYISAILPTLVELINQLIPVITQIITAILPILVQLINTLVPIFTQIVQMILPVIIELLNVLIPVVMQIITAILPVLTTLINALLPIIQMIASSILPAITQVLNVLIPLFQNIINAILPALMTMINAAVPVIQFLANILGSVLGAALQNITSIIQNVMTVFQGLISFITGVFTGNWSQAWNGIKSIFSGAVGGLGNIIKAPLNAVVSAVNSVINGLNKVKVPDWVPGMGGKGINIPTIPGFAKGTEETPETFIAGEEGPELITNAPKRAVYTAAETENIFAAQKAVAAAGKTPEVKTAPEVKASGGGGSSKSVVINQTNNITINGDKPEQLEETLQQNNEKLLQQVDEKLNGDEDERRTRYE